MSTSTRSQRALAALSECTDPRCSVGVILAELSGGVESDWMECIRILIFRQDIERCGLILAAAIDELPASLELRFALAGVYIQQGKNGSAESVLRGILEVDASHVAAAFLLAKLLKSQGRMQAVSHVFRNLFPPLHRHDVELVIQAVELLDDCSRQADAVAICENEISCGSTDPRLFAYSGMLLSQTGQFDLARARREFVMANSPHGAEWEVPLGLAEQQRYVDNKHKDFALFEAQLYREDLSKKARGSLLFALGKANDDIEEYEVAARCFHEANALAQSDIHWSRKQWRRSIDSRMARKLPEGQLRPPDWTPVFIVGVPRSGTTLLAQLLSRHPQICHRGELPWIPTLADRLSVASGPSYRQELERAARVYTAQLRQDDSAALWFIDKQPHNFMHVDFILKMFPNARFLYCRRNARDNALSLWTQSFQTGNQKFSYDFSNIAATIKGSRDLMHRWMKLYSDSVCVVEYEKMIADPAGSLNSISTWLALPAPQPLGANTLDELTSISTASFWQARQPVHKRSIGRWKHYSSYVPELLQIPDD